MEASVATTEPMRVGQYVDANGVRTYFEVTGEGAPLILLHGGFCTVETFDAQTPALASRYRVFVPERRGHGRTPDVAGPISYEVMAQDTIAFIETIGVPSAHLVGWSDGALVALLVALRRPDLVRKLVLIGQYVNLEGAQPEQTALMELMTQDAFPPMFKHLYASVSPDGPDHFGVVFDKLIELWRGDPGIKVSELRTVTAPTLILVADDDVVSIEHAAAMQRALPDSQLAVVPGTSHALPMEKPDLANRLVLDFLATEQVPKMLVLSDMLAPLSD
jgi:pimeloyl-ACP methyl ester carboxylesterase